MNPHQKGASSPVADSDDRPCDGCEAEGFRTRYCPDHAANFCDGCWERIGCPHPAGDQP